MSEMNTSVDFKPATDLLRVSVSLYTYHSTEEIRLEGPSSYGFQRDVTQLAQLIYDRESCICDLNSQKRWCVKCKKYMLL